MKLGILGRASLLLTGAAVAATSVAQTGPGSAPAGLAIPNEVRFLRQADPSVRKATAIVNGSVITGTDIDQRTALVVLAADGQVPADEMQRLREQVLRNLVDETLQIQAATAEEITVTPAEVDTIYQRYAQNFQRSPVEFAAYLRTIGSSEKSIKRQIHAEAAWSRLQRRQIEPFVNVSEEEVTSLIERMNAARGTQEYKIGEIFLSATPETAAEARANATRIVQQLRGGASFLAYARQFSEASTAAVGGDLGWVRAEQLPDPLAEAARLLPVGQISDPIAIPGGFSIIAVQDSRQVLTADPRDAVLSLKQISLAFPPGAPRAQVELKVQQLVRMSQSMGGCGGADAAATGIGAEVVSNDNVRVRELPPALQETLLALSIGQATPPFGAANERVSILVLCGRDDPAASETVSFDTVYNQLSEERVNRRARRYLRDLRRDAIVDYR